MEDLSSQLLSDRALIASSSMAPAGGSVSIMPDCGQPGSDSEAAEGVTQRTPGFALPAMVPVTTAVPGTDGTDYSPWSTAAGAPWKSSDGSDEQPPPRSRDQQGRWTQT